MYQKPTFLHQNKPILCCMIMTDSVKQAVLDARNAAYQGPDAFGLQPCKLPIEQRTEDGYRQIFAAMGNRPIYVTSYRHDSNADISDEERGERLLTMLKCGATLCDVIGDYFSPHPIQMTEDREAILKQMRLIDRIHSEGGEVVMSAHVLHFIEEREVIRIAKEQLRRGADVVKIVTGAESEEQELENLRITARLRQEIEAPFLFISGGKYSKRHRMLGAMFGSSIALCVQRYDGYAVPAQPLLSAMRAIYDSADILPRQV